MDRYRVRRALVVGIGIVLGLAAVQAVAAAPPNRTVVGVAYTNVGAQGVANATYTTIVSVAVPAGKYHVTGRITVLNQTGATVDSVSCNAYGNNLDFIDAGNGSFFLSGSTTSFPVTGVADLAVAGSIHLECISSVATEPLPLVSARLVAVTLANIVNAP